MASMGDGPSGAPLLVQPEAELLRQRSIGYGLTALCLGSASVIAVLSQQEPTSWPGVLVPVVAFSVLGVLALSMAIRQHAYALFENGIRLPSYKFVTYRDVRDVQRIERPGKKTKFLVLARTAGDFGVIGTPLTRNVWFATASFDAVESLVVEGVRRCAPEPDMEWDPDLWRRVSAFQFRGPVIVNAEKFAREHGVSRIDQPFLDDAVPKDHRIAYWLRAAAMATAKAENHPNRKPTPYDPRG